MLKIKKIYDKQMSVKNTITSIQILKAMNNLYD